MKKFLNNRKIIIGVLSAIFIFVLSAFFQKSFSQSKLEYYQKVFKDEFGVNVYKIEDSSDDVRDFFSDDEEEKYLILLSSIIKSDLDALQTSNQESINTNGSKKNIILICDEPFTSTVSTTFNCDAGSVSSTNGFIVGGIFRNEGTQNINLYVIPESLLISPEKRIETQKYVKAIMRSDSVPLVSEDLKAEEETQTLEDILSTFKDSMVFEAFSISVSAVILVAVFQGVLRLLSREGKRVSFEDLKNLFNINKNFSIYQRLIFFALIWMVSVFLTLMISISMKDGRGIDLGYIFSYALDSFNIKSIAESASSGSYFKVMVFFYETVVLSLILVLIIPSIIKLFRIGISKIQVSVIRQDFVKYTLFILIFLGLISTSFFDVVSSVGFLILVTILVSFIIYKQGKNLKTTIYSKKEKLLILSFGFIVIIIGFLFRLQESRVGKSYDKEDLIGVNDDVVLLPYSKQLGDDTLISEYIFSGSEPIFVNQYLVYDPSSTRIENVNVEKFKNEGTFYIQAGDVADIVSAIYHNKDLDEALKSESPSNLFRINNLSKGLGQNQEETWIDITFSCIRQNLGFDKIVADFYYLSEDGSIENENNTLMYFPGCKEAGKPEMISVKLDLPYTDSDDIFIRLKDVLGSDIKNIVIRQSDMVEVPTFYSKGRGYGVIHSKGLELSSRRTIVNYIFGESYNLSFDMDLGEDGNFDISKPINELIKQGVLKDRFLIWSTKKYLPVRLPD